MSARVSLIVPAHNESAFLPARLEAARKAGERIGGDLEIVVVLNRSTDDTEEIAERHGGSPSAKSSVEMIGKQPIISGMTCVPSDAVQGATQTIVSSSGVAFSFS